MPSVIAGLTVSGAAAASATTINIDGGVWDYGVGSGTVWSNYFHNGKSHGSTAVGTITSDSGCTNRNTWSRASAPSKVIGTNKTYYRFC
ncbi:lactococcin 972 family bacteriocin [Corynebacterium pacaense]|uniref:lactococcin 972 family bacteriocin n=1 Tax=Corynebacterium pacaense TaxID=1816684 RepID=UPI0009BA7022|nr:lactococcin 972 family bacteriocin [Corynebacterium pacaense]